MTKLRDFLDAAYNGDLVTVKRLCRYHGLEFDVNAGDPDYFGDTALHKASEQGHFAIVQFLCEECGADVLVHSSPSSQSPQGRRPSWTAWFFEQRVIYNYLRRQEHIALNSMSSLQIRIHAKSPPIDSSDPLGTPPGKEAKAFGEVHEVYSGKEGNFTHIPTQEELALSEHARYVHFTSNNTIFGTQFATEPETFGIPLVCDASSDFLSKPIDITRYGIIYAGAQKNLGPAGVTIVIARKDVLEGISKTDIPTIMDYRTHVQNLFNTPPVFPVYMVKLVLEWIQSKGGISYFERFNLEKATLLYSAIDEDDFYSGTADLASRSLMNVTFRLPSEELEKKFIQEATAAHLDALKGHRSVGGVRASIYNACPMESVQALVAFMADFKAKHG